MNSRIDDLGNVYKLLFENRQRYRSARATISHTLDVKVAKEANQRFVDWRFEQPGSPGIAWIGAKQSTREDFYAEYEDFNEVIHLWHKRPEHWREEILDADSTLLECNVAQTGGPWWFYESVVEKSATYIPSVQPDERIGMRFWFMLDPSDEVFQQELVDEATFHLTGRQTIVADREAIEVRAKTLSWGYPARVFHVFGAHLEGTTDHLLLVDAEVGTILRAAARLEGREYRVAEVTEISYDEEFSENIFRLELPGVEFRRSGHPNH